MTADATQPAEQPADSPQSGADQCQGSGSQSEAVKNDSTAFDWLAGFKAALANLPEAVEIPYELTPEGERLAKFRKICPPEFCRKVDRAQLPKPEPFDRVAQWDGSFPGPCATGKTRTAKTRATWSALGRLYVRQSVPFAWFPVRRLVAELEKYETYNAADEFFRHYSHFPVLMVDDADKINWAFESHGQMLFAFYDWVYRSRIPCITTTNRPRAWWANAMGDAFARRLFDDAHFAVEF